MEIKNSRILITGATGLIGYNLAKSLFRNKNTLFVTGRNKKKLESTFAEYLNNKNLHILEHDAIEPFPAIVKNIDYIFHAAGPMERDEIMNRPMSVILPNIQGTINCLEFLKKQKIEEDYRKRGK